MYVLVQQKVIYLIKTEPEKGKWIRKLDVAFISKKILVWYLFYFSHGQDFSKKIRGEYARKGYKLTNKGLFNRQSGKQVDFHPTKDEDIINFIKDL